MSSGTITVPRAAGLKQAAEQSLFGLVPVLATVALFTFQFRLSAIVPDFHAVYWPAASRLLHGLSPYATTHQQIAAGTAFVYPALAALVFAPFALLERSAAEVLYMLACIACVPATLSTLKVRDWRIYGVAMLWLPVYNGWSSGNVTLPLILLVALAWRHRERPLVAGVLTAAAISVKPFVWPLGLWLLATRRWKAAAWALGSGLLLNLLAWVLVGFNEISTFVHLSSEDTATLWKGGYSMLAVVHHLGLDRAGGELLLILVSALATVAVVFLGAVKCRERDALVLAIVLMLLASPLLWAHYFALLLVPLALMRPRLHPVWALPVLMWPMPPRQPVRGWQEALAWVIATAVLVVALRAPRRAATP